MIGARIKHIFMDDAAERKISTQNNNTARQLASIEANWEKDKSSIKTAKLVNSSRI